MTINQYWQDYIRCSVVDNFRSTERIVCLGSYRQNISFEFLISVNFLAKSSLRFLLCHSSNHFHLTLMSFSETPGRSRHHILAVWRSGPRSVPGDGVNPVRHHGSRQSLVPAQNCHGQSDFPGDPGVRYPLLDVFHPARDNRKVVDV